MTDEDDPDGAMAHLGTMVAGNLLAQRAGHPGTAQGWRGALQEAADASGQDPGVLTVADEIYQAAHDLITAAAVHAYATSTLPTIRTESGQRLLRGMLQYTVI